MKRHLLSLLLLSAFTVTVYAQSLQLSNNHGIIQANSIIVQEGSPDSVELITYMNVKNISSNSVDVLCKKIHLSMLDSTEITMCWAGQCYPPFVNISSFSKIIDAGQTNTEFIGHYTQTAFQHFKPGESEIRWTFYDRANVNDSVSVIVKYTTYPLSVVETNANQVFMSNAYPNPAGPSASFTYAFPSGSVAGVVIRNVLGATMLSEQITSSNGKFTINTGNLNDGVYFYSLVIDGKISQTKKLIVRH